MENEKYKNKLNIKDDLQNFWENEERIKKAEKEISIQKNNLNEKKINFEEPKIDIKNEKNEKTTNININTKKDDDDGIIPLIIQGIIGIIIIYFIYGYVKNSIEEETKQLKKEQIAYNKRIQEQKEEYLKNKKTENFEDYKDFKIKTKILGKNYNYDDVYNLKTIEKNLSSIKSKYEDTDYKIEIVGSISKYGNLFYVIYNKNSNKYDNEFYSMLKELKKIKYRMRNNDTNFKIIIDNNHMDLN